MTDQLAADELGGADPDPTAPGDAVTAAAGRRRRVSKWDRPPDPRDWRFFVGTLGKILIATGLLLFGFVAYQLWGTGIETARAQNTLEDQFAALLAESTPDDAPVDPADDPDADATADDLSSDDPIDDATVEPPDDADVEPPDDADVGPAVDPDGTTSDPDDLADQAIEQDLPPVVRGEVLARLEIPRIGKIGDDALYVVPGVGVDDLKKGPGHYPDTPLPGQLGNASIAGHRTTYGEPFFDIDRMQPGDEIVVTMASGDRFVYDVTGVEVVAADDYWVVTTRDPDIAELTLTSCHPKYTARDRIVVHGLLNPDKSARVGIPTFYDLGDDTDEPAPGDDPVITPDDSTDGTGTDAVDETSDGTDANDGEVDETNDDAVDQTSDGTETNDDAADAGPVAGAHDDPSSPDQAVGDAFARGWFHDRGAFPQIALWGTALTVISLAAYAISRRLRHDSIGFLVGIAPFVVALYFFFQNVNRLLPPGL